MLLKELFEADGKTVAINFGRMSPPTIGHEKLVKAVLGVNADDHFIIPSRTYVGQGKRKDRLKNPLPYDYKLGLIKKAFGDRIKVLSHPKATTIFGTMKYFEDAGYEKVFFVVGSDRIEEIDSLLKRYQGKDFNIPFEMVNAGQRDPDAEGAEGMSGTKLRQSVIDNDIDTLRTGLASNLQSDADSIMSQLRIGLEPWIDKESKTESINLRHNLKPGKYKHGEEDITIEIGKDGGVTFLEPQEWSIEGDPEYLEWVEGLLADKNWITAEAAGVGIITKQNTTKDVNKGTLKKMLKGYKLI